MVRIIIQGVIQIDWFCQYTWLQSTKNTLWCLLGCCIGDFGTIAYFQFMEIEWPVILIMSLLFSFSIFLNNRRYQIGLLDTYVPRIHHVH